jgi:hypothetical protein
MEQSENAGMGKDRYPIRLIGSAASGFYRTCFEEGADPAASPHQTGTRLHGGQPIIF